MSKWRQDRMDTELFEAAHQHHLPSGKAIQEAETVLLSLGYSMSEIHQGLQNLSKSKENIDTLSSEEVLQYVLKWLATHPVQ
jgi:Holliday junction resolvasome RuvABC DNA-binding subunit